MIEHIGRIYSIGIIGGRNKKMYRNINLIIKELQNGTDNIKLMDNKTEETIVQVKFHLTLDHFKEFLNKILYVNTQANIQLE